ncbi:MAG TPA: carbohydrate-binding protein [Candidatus Angelobacter sp.]
MKRNSLICTIVIAAFVCLLLPTPAPAQTVPAWAPNTAYAVGALVTYQSVEYKCLQAHTSQVGWEPPNVPALWQPVSGSPTPTPTPVPTATPTPTPAPTPTPTPGGTGGCSPTWVASQVYVAGNKASLNGINYTANFWTQNQSPATNNGGAGSGQPWTSNGSCVAPTPTPTPKATPTPTPLPPGARIFAPYIDMSLTADEQIETIQQQSGLKAFTLAFVVATGNGCSMGWGGVGGSLPTDTLPNGTTIQSHVSNLQAAGVQIIVSFGGANGSDISSSCTTASQLQAAYQQVINQYHVKMLDFDIEGGAVSNQAALTLRDQALKGLKAANAGLVISYTLPVLPTGLIASGVNVLTTAKNDGFTPDIINVMAMDYGSASDNNGQMGLDATQAAQNTHNQVISAGLSSNIGVTTMIGINDTNTEIFQLTDANTLLNFTSSNTYITRLAIWSVARDNGGCPNQGFASPTCSGITQSNFQFSQTFEAFK